MWTCMPLIFPLTPAYRRCAGPPISIVWARCTFCNNGLSLHRVLAQSYLTRCNNLLPGNSMTSHCLRGQCFRDLLYQTTLNPPLEEGWHTVRIIINTRCVSLYTPAWWSVCLKRFCLKVSVLTVGWLRVHGEWLETLSVRRHDGGEILKKCALARACLALPCPGFGWQDTRVRLLYFPRQKLHVPFFVETSREVLNTKCQSIFLQQKEINI